MRQATIKAKAQRAPKPRVKGDVVPPNYVLKLMEHIGPTAAAAAIGTTPGTLHKGRNAGAVTRSLEVAARGIWSEMGLGETEPPPAPEPRTQHLGEAVLSPASDSIVTFLVAVPADKAEVMRMSIKAMGGTIYVQQD